MNTPTLYFNTNIMPRHTRLIFLINIGDKKVPGTVNIRESEVTKVSAFPQLLILIVRVDNSMLLSIPPAIAHIKSAQKSNFLINNNDLLMMTPQKRNQNIIRMS